MPDSLPVPPPADQSLYIYNGLDCCITLEILQKLQALYPDDTAGATYGFARGLQGPVLEIVQRGWLIDTTERRQASQDLRRQIADLESKFQAMAMAIWDKPLNPRSTVQLQDFFYNHMHVPKIWVSKQGVQKLSMDEEVLEKISVYFHPRPIVACILAIRELTKALETISTEISDDGRMRFSLNIAGTSTGRFSSSSSAFHNGRNIQNISEPLRRMFIADPGYKLCGIDLEQAESREVGWLLGVLFDDWRYLEACYAGDLHTLVAKLVWPELPWTGVPAEDRALAEQPFSHGFSRRDLSKRAGHASNYRGSAHTIARVLHLPLAVVEAFQAAYYGAFPALPLWHKWVAGQLRSCGYLTTPFGRRRHFFGRVNDDTTLREAIAFSPQSSTADRMNLGLWRIWRYMPEVKLLAQVHDAVYFLYPPDQEATLIPKALDLISVPLHHGTHTLIVPGEAKIGWNWASAGGKDSRPNPDGLIKFKPGKPDLRERSSGLSYVL